jgi:hypothetical protein
MFNLEDFDQIANLCFKSYLDASWNECLFRILYVS